MSKRGDYLVTVCTACRRASCWQAVELCDESPGAGTVEVPSRDLRAEKREHPSWYSMARLERVTGFRPERMR